MSGEGTLPLRKDGQIETRPLHVEEWLETLPYADFQRCGQLLHETMAASNKLSLKPGIREELLALYDRPYRYYLQAQIRTGAQHTLTSMETMQQQLRLMKLMAGDLAHMAQHVVNDTHNARSLWGSKLPLQATDQAINYLSQALIFNYLEYAPTPAKVWQQLHSLYRFAESLGKLQTPIKRADGSLSSIGHSYMRIALTEIVDPYHLPFGGIWEIYDQVDDWLEQSGLEPLHEPDCVEGLFVIDLASDSAPIPCNRFDTAQASDNLRLLDARPLQTRAQQCLELIQQQRDDIELRLSTNYRRLLTAQMVQNWHQPLKRSFPRKDAKGSLPLACGLKPIHFHMNGGHDLLEQINNSAVSAVDGMHVDDGANDTVNQTTSNYALEQWNLLNKSPDGCALSRELRPLCNIRVGDLIGLRLAETDSGSHWRLGIVRWLMIESGQHYKIGVQLLGRDSEPVALWTNGRDERPQRAFRISDSQQTSLLTARGMLQPEQRVKVRGPSEPESASLRIIGLVEEVAAFEQFSAASPS